LILMLHSFVKDSTNCQTDALARPCIPFIYPRRRPMQPLLVTKHQINHIARDHLDQP
jgi:hypothetical protein